MPTTCYARTQASGIMVVNDYTWSEGSPRDLDRPHMAIEAFLHIYADQMDVLFKGSQVSRWLKESNPFIQACMHGCSTVCG